jgi:hypothetical protein
VFSRAFSAGVCARAGGMWQVCVHIGHEAGVWAHVGRVQQVCAHMLRACTGVCTLDGGAHVIPTSASGLVHSRSGVDDTALGMGIVPKKGPLKKTWWDQTQDLGMVKNLPNFY